MSATKHRWLAACAALLVSASAALAQSWPSKPVRIIVPVTAGSATDVTARVVAEHLAQQLGQPFVVENRTGAGGTTGMGYVAK
jgi:tripartite-type tricarboxylate transporter receptor subunit TctC